MIRKALLALLFMAPAGLMAAPFGPAPVAPVAHGSPARTIGTAGHVVGLLTQPVRFQTAAEEDPTPEPSPSEDPSPDPTVSPDPSDSPTPEPTDTPSPEPSDSPTPDPSTSPEPDPDPEPEPPNTPPEATDDAYATDQGIALSVPAPGVLGNDTDADNDAITATLTSGPAHGSLTLKTDGSFTYTPSSGYTGNDVFRYAANDGTDSSDPATVTISVTSRCPSGGCTKNFTCNGGGCYASSGCSAGHCNIHFTCDGGGCAFAASCAGGDCVISSSCGGGGCSFKSSCDGGGCDITSSCADGGCSTRSACDGGGCSFTSSCQGGGCSNKATCNGGDCETDITCNGGGCCSSGGRYAEANR